MKLKEAFNIFKELFKGSLKKKFKVPFSESDLIYHNSLQRDMVLVYQLYQPGNCKTQSCPNSFFFFFTPRKSNVILKYKNGFD